MHALPLDFACTLWLGLFSGYKLGTNRAGFAVANPNFYDSVSVILHLCKFVDKNENSLKINHT